MGVPIMRLLVTPLPYSIPMPHAPVLNRPPGTVRNPFVPRRGRQRPDFCYHSASLAYPSDTNRSLAIILKVALSRADIPDRH